MRILSALAEISSSPTITNVVNEFNALTKLIRCANEFLDKGAKGRQVFLTVYYFSLIGELRMMIS